jgi:hypothetical protein
MDRIGPAATSRLYGNIVSTGTSLHLSRYRLVVIATALTIFRRQVLGEGTQRVKTRSIATGVISAGMILTLASCTNPYDPGQRAVGGGLLGAGAGAAIGGIAGGGRGAAIGAITGGAVGAVAGAATTPPPPPPPPRY